mgnify:CR=1 FL=1
MLQSGLGARAGRLGRAIDDASRHIHLPAVVEAAQTAFLVAGQRERGAAVRAVEIEHAELAVGIAERDEVLAQKAERRGLAVRLGDFLGQAGRDPVRTHEATHRRIAFDPAQEIVVCGGEHRVWPCPASPLRRASAGHMLRYLNILTIRASMDDVEHLGSAEHTARR